MYSVQRSKKGQREIRRALEKSHLFTYWLQFAFFPPFHKNLQGFFLFTFPLYPMVVVVSDSDSFYGKIGITYFQTAFLLDNCFLWVDSLSACQAFVLMLLWAWTLGQESVIAQLAI